MEGGDIAPVSADESGHEQSAVSKAGAVGYGQYFSSLCLGKTSFCVTVPYVCDCTSYVSLSVSRTFSLRVSRFWKGFRITSHVSFACECAYGFDVGLCHVANEMHRVQLQLQCIGNLLSQTR